MDGMGEKIKVALALQRLGSIDGSAFSPVACDGWLGGETG